MFFRNTKFLMLIAGVLLAPVVVLAQSDEPTNYGTVGFGGLVRSNGMGLAFQKQSPVLRSGISRHYYVDFVTHKHLRESKIVNHKVENKMPYVFGKLNHNALTRFAFGFSKALVDRSGFNNVGVSFQGGLGLSVAAQRPVYVRVEAFEDDVQIVKNVKYTPQNVPDSEKIIGYSRNGEGWDELTYRPGLVARANFAINWKEYSRSSKQVNVGATLDYFPNGLPIMAFVKNPSLYPTFYIGFMWGFQTRR